MSDITATQRRSLRAKAHHLVPVVAIGKEGLSPAVQHEIDLALLAHELIKVRVLNDDRDARAAMLAATCAALGCAPVQHVGKVFVLWRFNPDKKAPKDTTGTAKAKPKAHGTKAAAEKRRRLERDPDGDGKTKGVPRGNTRPRGPVIAKAGPVARKSPARPAARSTSGKPAEGSRKPGEAPAKRKPAPSTQGVPYFSRRGAGRFVSATPPDEAPPPATRRRTRT